MGEYSNVKMSENVIVLLIVSLYVTYNSRRISPWLLFVAIYGSGCLSTHAMGSPTADGMESTMVANNRQDRMKPTMVNSPTTNRTEWSQQWSPKTDRMEHTRTHMLTDSN